MLSVSLIRCKNEALKKSTSKASLMPSLHLLRSSYDGLVQAWISLRFSLRFGGHRRWLRATIFMFTLFTVIVRFHVLGIVELPKTKPYRGCTEIVQILCDDRADIIRSYDFCTMLFCSPCWKKKLYARCMISARPPHDDPALVRCHLRCV